MKHIAQSLTLGLAVLAASAASPKAADWAVSSGGAVVRDFGSIKDYSNAGVPVPAPRPAPDQGHAEWYIRADVGWNLATSVDVTATGGAIARNDLNGFAFGSVGGGRYITPSLRAELMFDFRPKKTVSTGSSTFNYSYRQAGKTAGTTDLITAQVTQTDNSHTTDNGVFFNVYQDFNPAGRFTPYIGAGIGLDLRSFKRNISQSVACGSATNVDATGVATAYPTGTCPDSPALAATYSTGHYVTDIGIAGAFMVGAAYKISNGIAIDTGYRLLWEGAQVSASGTGIQGPNNIKISDRLDHEIRTGVRIDLN